VVWPYFLKENRLKKKENGMPAFAGMTVIIEKYGHKKHRHAREGGHPIWFLADFNHLNLLFKFFNQVKNIFWRRHFTSTAATDPVSSGWS
jgi:hypothetical protein